MSFLNLFSTKEKVKFDIHIKDISFIKNEYFLSHSRYSIELPDYHSKVEAKHDVATSSDLNKVSFRHSMKFISTLTVNSRAGKSHFEPKNKKIIVRQTSPDLNPRGSDVLIADIGHAILPLHELANAVKDQDYFLEIHDSDVVGRIRITVRHLNMSKTHSSSDLHTRDTFLGRSVSAYSMEGEAEAPPHGLSVQISQNSNHSQTSSNNSSFHSTNADRSVNQEIVGKKLTPTNRHKKKPSGSNHDEVLKALSQEEENSEAFKTTNTTEKDPTEHKCVSIELQPVDTENRKQLSSAAEKLTLSRDEAGESMEGGEVPNLKKQISKSTSEDGTDLAVDENNTRELLREVEAFENRVNANNAPQKGENDQKEIQKKGSFFSNLTRTLSPKSKNAAVGKPALEDDLSLMITVQKKPFEVEGGNAEEPIFDPGASHRTLVDSYVRQAALSKSNSLETVDAEHRKTPKSPNKKNRSFFLRKKSQQDEEIETLHRQVSQLHKALKLLAQDKELVDTDRTEKCIRVMNLSAEVEELKEELRNLRAENNRLKAAEAIAIESANEKEIKLRSVLTFMEEKIKHGEFRIENDSHAHSDLRKSSDRTVRDGSKRIDGSLSKSNSFRSNGKSTHELEHIERSEIPEVRLHSDYAFRSNSNEHVGGGAVAKIERTAFVPDSHYTPVRPVVQRTFSNDNVFKSTGATWREQSLQLSGGQVINRSPDAVYRTIVNDARRENSGNRVTSNLVDEEDLFSHRSSWSRQSYDGYDPSIRPLSAAPNRGSNYLSARYSGGRSDIVAQQAEALNRNMVKQRSDPPNSHYSYERSSNNISHHSLDVSEGLSVGHKQDLRVFLH